MKNLLNSIYAQIGYMVGMGFGFLVMPNVVLPLFGFSPVDDIWIRVLGALAIGVAGYYFMMSRERSLPFFTATVWGRYWFCGCLFLLTALRFGEKPLYLFAVLETGLAVWTHLALSKIKSAA